MERLFEQLRLDPGLVEKILVLQEIGLEFLSEGHKLRQDLAVCLHEL